MKIFKVKAALWYTANEMDEYETPEDFTSVNVAARDAESAWDKASDVWEKDDDIVTYEIREVVILAETTN